jgi:hypothetical protein
MHLQPIDQVRGAGIDRSGRPGCIHIIAVLSFLEEFIEDPMLAIPV